MNRIHIFFKLRRRGAARSEPPETVCRERDKEGSGPNPEEGNLAKENWPQKKNGTAKAKTKMKQEGGKSKMLRSHQNEDKKGPTRLSHMGAVEDKPSLAGVMNI